MGHDHSHQKSILYVSLIKKSTFHLLQTRKSLLFPLKSVLHLKQAEVVFNKVNIILTRSAVCCLSKVTKSKQTKNKSCVCLISAISLFFFKMLKENNDSLAICHCLSKIMSFLDGVLRRFLRHFSLEEKLTVFFLYFWSFLRMLFRYGGINIILFVSLFCQVFRSLNI